MEVSLIQLKKHWKFIIKRMNVLSCMKIHSEENIVKLKKNMLIKVFFTFFHLKSHRCWEDTLKVISLYLSSGLCLIK